jgi:tetratricopeptide (TPR) repeat protein
MYKIAVFFIKRGTHMTSTIARIVLFSFLFLLFIPHLTSAETKTFIKEYTYTASDEDSKNSSRTISLREVKRLLLEELGTYLETITEVQNFQLTKDKITALTAGIVQTEVVEEKWDGKTYWLKSRIQADSNEVIKSLDVLRKDRQKTKELEEMRQRSDELLRENEKLRQELSESNGKDRKEKVAVYNQQIKEMTAAEWWEKGSVSSGSGKWPDAIDSFSKAIELNPQIAGVYSYRGGAYFALGNYIQAMKDFDKAIELDPKYAKTYCIRGLCYGVFGNYSHAIKDSDKCIELNPTYSLAYELRAQLIRDMQIAARSGHNGAQKILREKGISW